MHKRSEERNSIQLQNLRKSKISKEETGYNTSEIKYPNSHVDEYKEIYPNLILTLDEAIARSMKYKLLQRVQTKKKSEIKKAIVYLDVWSYINNIVSTDFGKDTALYFKVSRWFITYVLVITLACVFFLVVPMEIIIDINNARGGAFDYKTNLLPTNENWLTDSPLFYGYYNQSLQGNGTIVYSISRAYFWVNILTRILYILVILRKFIFCAIVLYTEKYSSSILDSSLGIPSVIGMWDFRSLSKRSTRFCRDNIKDFLKKSYMTNTMSKNATNGVNIFINVLAIALIAAACERISWFITEDEIYFQKNLSGTVSIWLYLRSPATVSMIIVFSTWVFDLMKCVEDYSEEFWKILASTIRIILLNCGVAIILLYHWSTMISCTNPNSILSNRSSCELLRGRISIGRDSLLYSCWETWLGQRILIYLLVNIAITFIFYFVIDIIKSVFNLWHTSSMKPKFFYTALIGNLCYMDFLFWIGYYYSPILSIVWLVLVIILFFYNINVISITCFPRGSSPQCYNLQKAMFSCMLLLSSSIGICALFSHSLLYKPSRNCGPFNKLDYNYSPETFTTSKYILGNTFVKKAIEIGDRLLTSDGFWYSVIIVLISLAFKFTFKVNGLRKVYQLALGDKGMIEKEKKQASENCQNNMERLRLKRLSFLPTRCKEDSDKVSEDYDRFVI